MATLPEHQGRGLGRRVLADLLAQIAAAAPGEPHVTLMADAPERRLYESMRFVTPRPGGWACVDPLTCRSPPVRSGAPDRTGPAQSRWAGRDDAGCRRRPRLRQESGESPVKLPVEAGQSRSSSVPKTDCADAFAQVSGLSSRWRLGCSSTPPSENRSSVRFRQAAPPPADDLRERGRGFVSRGPEGPASGEAPSTDQSWPVVPGRVRGPGELSGGAAEVADEVGERVVHERSRTRPARRVTPVSCSAAMRSRCRGPGLPAGFPGRPWRRRAGRPRRPAHRRPAPG